MSDEIPPTHLTLYKAKPVSTVLSLRMATDYASLVERFRQLNNAQAMINKQWAIAQTHIINASIPRISDKRRLINFGDPYNAIAKAGTRKLAILTAFIQEYDVLEPRLPFIRKPVLKFLGTDVERYATRKLIMAELATHVHDTLDKLERLERFMTPEKLKHAQDKHLFSLNQARLILAKQQVYIDALTKDGATSSHVPNGSTPQSKGGQIVPFIRP